MAKAQRLFVSRAVLGVLALLPAAAALTSCESAVAQDGRAAPASTDDARVDALLRALASGDDDAARAAMVRGGGTALIRDEVIARVRRCQVEAVTPARGLTPLRVLWRCRVPHLRSAVFYNAGLATMPRSDAGVAVLDFSEGRVPRPRPAARPAPVN